MVIDTGVPREACPLGLAPTASTTAMLAMGDALAVVLLTKRGFQASDFQRFHPGGSLGERLNLAIREVMLTGDQIPRSRPEEPLAAAIREMGAKKLGATLVVDREDKLAGIVTDGDLRRALGQFGQVLERPVQEVMTADPLAVGPGPWPPRPWNSWNRRPSWCCRWWTTTGKLWDRASPRPSGPGGVQVYGVKLSRWQHE